MLFLLGSALAAALVTMAAAKLVTMRAAAASGRRQVLLAASAFPLLALVIFAIGTALALADGAHVKEPGGTTGMVIFALSFFLFYALAVGAIVGLPTAFAAVRLFGRRG